MIGGNTSSALRLGNKSTGCCAGCNPFAAAASGSPICGGVICFTAIPSLAVTASALNLIAGRALRYLE